MKGKGVRPDVVTYTSLINGLYNFGKWNEAREMLREMLESGILPDVHMLTVLVSALSKKGKTKEAEELFEVMEEIGLDPNIVTYSSLMEGLFAWPDGRSNEIVKCHGG